jgi:hypothetical protein
MPHLHAALLRHAEDRLRPEPLGQEHPHRVVALAPVGAQVLEVGEHRGAVALEADVEHLASRTGQLADAALARDLALVEHDHLVADALDVVEQVRAEDQAHAAARGDVADQHQHLLAALRVESVRGLVEQQQLGVVHERLRELHALLHARRVGLEVSVARLAEPDVVEHLVRPADRLVAREARQLAGERDEGRSTHPGDVAVLLGHVAEAPPHLERLARRVLAERGHPPAVGCQEAEQRLEQRRLARTIRTEQPGRPG